MSLNFLNLFGGGLEKKLQNALESYQNNPGEQETLKVAQLLMKKRDYNQAFMYADNGYQRFTNSKELLDMRQLAMKKLAIEECRELQAKLATAPRPESVAKIIEIRRSLNDFKNCEKMCKKWSGQFNESWVLQFAIAKYLFQRSMIEKDPKISERCLNQLEVATRLNPDNYKTLLYLATLQQQLGKKSKALKTAERLVELYPEDARARSLYDYIGGPNRRVSKASANSSPVETADPQEIFSEIRSLPSVQAALLNDEQDGTYQTVDSHFKATEEFNWEKGEEVLMNLLHSMETSSQRMGIGQLEGFELKSDAWGIHFQGYEGGCYMFCADKNLKKEKITEWKEKVSSNSETVST